MNRHDNTGTQANSEPAQTLDVHAAAADEARAVSYPLTNSQQEIWFDQVLHAQVSLYNLGGYARLEGPIDIERFEQAASLLVQRHDNLRLVMLAPEAGSLLPRQTFIGPMRVCVPLHDFSGQPDPEVAAWTWMQQRLEQPFTLYGEAMFRHDLVKVGPERHYWLMQYHHLIVDAWAIALLFRSLGDIYTALSDERDVDLLAPSFVPFIEKDLEYAQSPLYEKHRAYWVDKYAELPPRLFERSRLARETNAVMPTGCHSVELTLSLYERIASCAATHGSTPFQVILAAMYVSLVRTAQLDEMTVGLDVLNRPNAAFKVTAGLFSGVSPVRLSFGTELNFDELLKSIDKTLRQDYRNQRFPISAINQALGVRKTGRDQLFDLSMSYMLQDHGARFGDALATRTGVVPPPLQTPLNLYICNFQGHDGAVLQIDYVYNTAFLDHAQVQAIAQRLEFTLEQVLRDPSVPIGAFALVQAPERERLLVEWNNTQLDYPRATCVHELIEAHAACTPDRQAVVCEGEHLSYGELNACANRMAHYLRDLGVGPETRVAICAERGLALITGLLAILKAGGAYVPLDPSYPRERLAYLVADSDPTVVLVDASGAKALGDASNAPCVMLHSALQANDAPWSGYPDGNIAPAALGLNASNLAYVIYTSGSTGTPKGVMVEHRSLVASTWARLQTYGRYERFLLLSSISFDSSVAGVFGTLASGGALCIPLPGAVMSPAALRGAIQAWRVTSMLCVPSLLQVMLDGVQGDEVATLTQVIVAGEACWPALVSRVAEVLPHAVLYNEYGPTEASVWSTFHVCSAIADQTLVPIGRPIANCKIYLLDAHGHPVPTGAPGELYVGGAGVARGYLNRPELSAAVFVADPFAAEAGARMYKSADMARYLPNGQIEYLGRNDTQVKIRGFRVEPGEIVARLQEHPSVREAAVLAREDTPGNLRLVAYCAGKDDTLNPQVLHAYLSAALPEYMVPAEYVMVAAMPLTANGKLDRKALPAVGAQVGAEYQEPLGEGEATLARIWGELLHIERVGRHDHFFDLGGHSLLAMSLIERMRQAGLQVAVSALFMNPTLAELAATASVASEALQVPPNRIPADCIVITSEMLTLTNLNAADIQRVVDSVPGGAANVQDIYPLGPLQEGILFHHAITKGGDPYLSHVALSFDNRVRLDAFVDAMQSVIARHDMLRTSVLWEGLPEAVQVVWRRARLNVEQVDIDPGVGDVTQQLRDRFDQRHYRLDVRQAPLMRACIAQDAPNGRWVMLWLFHHLMDDNTSLKRMLLEVKAYLDACGDALPPPLSFRNYVAQTRLGISRAEHEAFFRELLHGVAEPTLPFGLRDVHSDGSDVVQATCRVDAVLARRLRESARTLGATVASVFHLAWAQVLARVSGRNDVVFGTVLFGRMQGGEGAQHMLGMLINTLPMRFKLAGLGAQSGVRASHAQLARLLRHEHAPLALAQRCSGIAAPAPLFAALLNFRHGAQDDNAIPTLDGIDCISYKERTNLPLTMTVDGLADGFELMAQVRSPVDPQRVCGYMLAALHSLVDALEHAPLAALDTLAVLPAPERDQLLTGWNNPQADTASPRCIHELFEAQAACTPDAVALVFEGQQLSYLQLNQRANRLAQHLRRLGAKPDARVAVCMERSLDMVVGLLATLKAGAAYVPLDPAYPAERLVYLLKDSAPMALLTHAQVPEAVLSALCSATGDGIRIVDVDADAGAWAEQDASNPTAAAVALTPAHLAYLIYTSGSTGEPKGVMVEHAQVTRLFAATNGDFRFKRDDVWTLFHSFAFDFSVWELWGALLHGGSLIVVPQRTCRSPQDFYRLVCEQGVTVLNQTPSAFRQFIAAQQQSVQSQHQLRCVIFGGEALELATLRPWYALAGNLGTQLVNMYGITETTVHVTYRALVPADAERPGASPIGTRLSDLRIYILDAARQPAPVGVVGELYVGGAGVARGYWNRAALTAERFLADPFCEQTGARMYKTADLGRFLCDGSIEFLGRNDSQVKIRGFRIELGEIEARLLEHAAVREVVVLAREDSAGDQRLVAYCVGRNDTVGPQALRAYLSRVLPDHMLPAAYVMLAKLPLTENGKLDHKALPAPQSGAYAGQAYEAPQGETEATLARIWAEVLHVERVGRHDHFFELGGHSLLAMSLIERMRQAGLPAQASALFTMPTLASFAATIGGSGDAVVVPPNRIPPGCDVITPQMLPLVDLSLAEIQCVVDAVPGGAANIQDIYPLGPLQEGMLFQHRLSTEGDPYLLRAMLAFDSRARLDGFVQAMQLVIARHDILRTSVVWNGLPEAVQVVWRQARLSVEEVDLDPQAGDVAGQLRERFDLRRYRLDVRQAPLMRACVANDPVHGRWVMLWMFHHLMDDNTSLKRMLAEIRALLQGRADSLPEPLPFRNHVAQARLGVAPAEHEAFFRELLADVQEPTLPFGLGDVHADGAEAAEAACQVDTALAWRLRDAARALGVNAASVFHLAWALVLSRVSGRSDVVFGTVLFGRMQGGEGMNRMLGMLINTLPMRITLAGLGAQVGVQQTHAQLARLLRHEHAPLALVQRCSGIAAPAPLFAALLNFRHGAKADEAARGLEGVDYLSYQERTGYPLMLSVDDLGDGFQLSAQSRSPVDPVRVCAFMQAALESLVVALESAPHQLLGTLDVLPTAERQLLLVEWNASDSCEPDLRCVHELFEAQVVATPQATALVHGSLQMSYAELNAQANRLARHLRSLGVRPDSHVALCAERGVEMVVGVLAILKAGGAYVPLDPEYPVQRLQSMLRDCMPVVLLSHGPAALTLSPMPATAVLDLRADAPRWSSLASGNLPRIDIGLQPHHLAYVIYTSGSSGLPKGVTMPHAPLVNLLNWQRGGAHSPEPLRTLQFAALGFDVAFQEIFSTLCSGAALELIDNATRMDLDKLFGLVCERGVQRLYLPYIALQQLAEAVTNSKQDVGAACALREVITAGEQLRITPQIARLFAALPLCRLHNHYGPTETHVTTAFALPVDTAAWPALPPIGRPIANTRAYVLNDTLQPTPVGVAGELYLAGASMARGYWNRPDLTAERFVDDPFHGGCMYKTGDLVRHLNDGQIEFLGRNDFQVKIRGFRIELGEIETQLAQHPGIRESVVLAREDASGDKRLVAYYVSVQEIDAQTLRERLGSVLPAYMVPVAYVRLEHLPLSPNGKLDRKSLPAPDVLAYATREYETPQGTIETELAQLWSELLGVPQVGRHDNFFALGGHSLLAMRLVSRLQQRMGVELSLQALFAAAELAELADLILDARLASYSSADIEEGVAQL